MLHLKRYQLLMLVALLLIEHGNNVAYTFDLTVNIPALAANQNVLSFVYTAGDTGLTISCVGGNTTILDRYLPPSCRS